MASPHGSYPARRIVGSFVLSSIIALISADMGAFSPLGFFVAGFVGGLSLKLGKRTAFGYGIGFILPGIVVPLLLVAIQAMGSQITILESLAYPVGFGIAFGLAGLIGGLFIKQGMKIALRSCGAFAAGGATGGAVIALTLLLTGFAPGSSGALLAGGLLGFFLPFLIGSTILARVLRDVEPADALDEKSSAPKIQWQNVAMGVLSILSVVLLGIAGWYAFPALLARRRAPAPPTTNRPADVEWPVITETGTWDHTLEIDFFGKRVVNPQNLSFTNDRYGRLTVSHNGRNIPPNEQRYGTDEYNALFFIGAPETHRGLWTISWQYQAREYLETFLLSPESPGSSRCFLKVQKRNVYDPTNQRFR